MKVILIDLDNTILNFDRAERNAFYYVAERFLGYCDERLFADFRKINDAYWRRFEKGEIASADLAVRRFRDLFIPLRPDLDPVRVNIAYLQQLAGHPYYEENGYETIKYLAAKYPTYIITNGILSVQTNRVAISGLDKIVRGVIYADEVGFNKPNAEFFLRGLPKVGLDPTRRDDYIVIGDSLTSDIAGAVAMNYRFVWYNRTKEKKTLSAPEYARGITITDLRELRDIL